MADNSEDGLVAQVIEITACDENLAKQLLSVCANNVEAAIALFFEQETNGIEAGPSAAPVAGGSNLLAENNGEDDVRPPIAPIREQLIDAENDNFFIGRPVRTYMSAQRVKVCPLRDFAREAALMEQQLQAAAGEYIPSSVNGSGSGGQRRAAGMVSAALNSEPKDARLVDLFRPPTDIIYGSTFQIARKHATSINMWLLVNIQDDNFDSQVLNRDVWSNKKFRLLTRRNFVFWQVNQDSGEGRRFSAFYKCGSFPYVCVIDPQTGEEVLRIDTPDQSNILPALQRFIDDNATAEEERPSTSKRSMPILIDDEESDDEVEDTTASCSTANRKETNPLKKAKIMELSEEEQIAMAIRNSMNENGGSIDGKEPNGSKSNGSSRRGGNIIIDDDSMSSNDSMGMSSSSALMTTPEMLSFERLLGKSSEIAMIKIRLLDVQGNEEVTHLKWPSDTPSKALRAYVCQMYPHIPKKDKNFKIICAFPRTSLEEDSKDSTLKELGLFPSAYLHVTLD